MKSKKIEPARCIIESLKSAGVSCGRYGIVENLNPRHRRFFDEQNYKARWTKLLEMSGSDYPSFRVLFPIELYGLLDKWKEPTSDELNQLLDHALDGTLLGVRTGRLMDMFLAIWPLEMAKYDVMLYKSWLTNGKDVYRRYFYTSLKLHLTAIVQTWWAFETMINDFAGIIKEARKEKLSIEEKNVIEEINISINKKGQIEQRGYYQPIDSRIQFIYELLTGHSIERGGTLWQNIQSLKTERDIYQHRLGKENQEKLKLDSKIPIDGMDAVKTIISNIFAKTPEFSDKFVYKFYEFWSCNTDSPFMWDGKCGCGFSLGINLVSPVDMINVFAPMPNMINEASESMCPSKSEEDGIHEKSKINVEVKAADKKRKNKLKKGKRKK